MPRAWTLKDTGRMWWFAGVVAISVVSWTASSLGQEDSQVLKGVVVEEVGEGSALEKAGLRPGDVVLAWKRLPSAPENPEGTQGTIDSVFDWIWLKVEQAPRGAVMLTAQRDWENKVFKVVHGEWKADVRARMPEEMLQDFQRGKELIEAEEIEPGINLWHKAAKIAENHRIKDEHLICWLLLRIGDAWSNVRQWERAHNSYHAALEKALNDQSRVAVCIPTNPTTHSGQSDQ